MCLEVIRYKGDMGAHKAHTQWTIIMKLINMVKAGGNADNYSVCYYIRFDDAYIFEVVI